jgi:arylsulfatase A-like enzyme
MPPASNIIVIVVDRLGSHWLGPYGNAWVETPAINHLAAESTLWEFMVSDACDLPTLYRGYLTGQPAWRSIDEVGPTLPQLASAAGYETLLVTDSAEVAHHPLASGFEHIDLLAWQRPARTAAQPSETRVAEVFTAAREALAGSSKVRKLLWIHAAAMNAAWDAPYELRERLVAEDDPQPQKFVAPPVLELAKNYDPDEMLGIVQAYAAEVASLDDCLSTLLESLREASDPENTLLIFTSPRGYPLGEHLHVGSPGDGLRGEVLQVPLLVRFPGGAGKLTRVGDLRQSSDVFEIVAAQLSETTSEARHPVRDVIVACGQDEIAFRTAHWFFRQSGMGDERRAELYAKPDDFWEVNEVSARAADVVAAFEELADWVRSNRELPGCPNLPALPEILTAARR